MSDTLFNSEDKPEVKAAATTSENKTAEKNDVEALAKRVNDSQEFIETLKKENADLRAKVDKATAVESILAKLQQAESKTSSSVTADDKTDVSADLVLKKVGDLVDSKLSAQKEERLHLEREKVRNDNAVTVSAALVRMYGSEDKAKNMIVQKAKELGKTMNSLEALAKDDPKVCLALFSQTMASPRVTASDASSVRTEALGMNQDTVDSDLKSAADSMVKDPWRFKREFKQLEANLMDKYSKK